ncbi:hypothetical protein PC9H_006967 [Pleurotus ostreatus]|uniref:Uncharacterized protein n=1 Tax=Pleurotus ostreatus TaxID=5322 RepID=A0A8H6ZXN9_PLEOS|nr:uncharacterized protein PC9H_006967 [Pleurotus ostreatus]KAF7431245.1 hypothetical protein PC9H_006967 [Pleurotus ostreatus]
MPVDPSTKSKLKRRSSRRDIDEFKFDGTHARELEMKRNRGASSAPTKNMKIAEKVAGTSWNRGVVPNAGGAIIAPSLQRGPN